MNYSYIGKIQGTFIYKSLRAKGVGNRFSAATRFASVRNQYTHTFSPSLVAPPPTTSTRILSGAAPPATTSARSVGSGASRERERDDMYGHGFICRRKDSSGRCKHTNSIFLLQNCEISPLPPRSGGTSAAQPQHRNGTTRQARNQPLKAPFGHLLPVAAPAATRRKASRRPSTQLPLRHAAAKTTKKSSKKSVDALFQFRQKAYFCTHVMQKND